MRITRSDDNGTVLEVGRLAVTIPDHAQRCGIHGDLIVDRRCSSCDDHGPGCDGPLNCVCS